MKKGFTLIELLAVIVILAIIYLIATPIVLNIINDTKESSNKRSIEQYAKAIENAIAREELNGNEIEPGDLNEEFLKTVEYNGSEVLCKTNKLYKDGALYLADCKVDGKEVKYEYGEYVEKQITAGQYYWYGIDINDKHYIEGNISNESAALPTNLLDTPPAGKTYYLKLHTDDGKNTTAAYICIKKDGNEYCLKGFDPEAYTSNQEIMEKAFDESSLMFGDAYLLHTDGSPFVLVSVDGDVSVYDDTGTCDLTVSEGSFSCH